jgi:NADH dehydrogenase FAD-containing subunit
VGVMMHDGLAVGTGHGLLLPDGSTIPADCVIAATGAAPPCWLKVSGLQLDEQGYVTVDFYHRSLSHSRVFAAGDVCSRRDRNFARSGVHAVRAGPVLARNLAAALSGRRLRAYRPRRRSLPARLRSTQRHRLMGQPERRWFVGLALEGSWRARHRSYDD